MKNKLLYLIFISTLFQFGCNNSDDGVDYMDFLGTESYFMFFDDIVPKPLSDTLKYYSDSIGYDYFKLLGMTPIAARVNGQYDVNQIIFMQYEDPFEEKNFTDVNLMIDFYEQKNSLLSMRIQIDTMLQTISPHMMYKIDDITKADTMFIVTESGDGGYFMIYGNADTEIDRSIMDMESMTIVENSHNYHKYGSVIVIVGQKINDGIKRIAFFEYIKENENTPYQEGAIKAFADKDDMSYSRD